MLHRYLARKKAREEREAAENGLVNGDDAEGKDAEGGKDTVVVEAYAAEVRAVHRHTRQHSRHAASLGTCDTGMPCAQLNTLLHT